MEVFIVQLESIDGSPFMVNGIIVDEERITFEGGEACNVESLKSKINDLFFPESRRPLG